MNYYVQENIENCEKNIPEIFKHLDFKPDWEAKIIREFQEKMKFLCRNYCPSNYEYTQVPYCKDCQILIEMATNQINEVKDLQQQQEQKEKEKLEYAKERQRLREQRKNRSNNQY